MKKFFWYSFSMLMIFAFLTNGGIFLNGSQVTFDLTRIGTIGFSKISQIIQVMLNDPKEGSRTPVRKKEKKE